MHLGVFCIANAPSRETRGARRARAVLAWSLTRLTRAPVYPETPCAFTGPGRRPSAATHPFNRLQLSSYTNCNLGGRPVAFRLGWPVATALDGWLQLRLYTSSNSARQPIASSVVHKLQLIPSTDCNFRRTQIATRSHARCVPASLPGGAVLAWERVEVCGPRLISGLVGPVAQTRHGGWPGCILYTDCTQVRARIVCVTYSS